MKDKLQNLQLNLISTSITLYETESFSRTWCTKINMPEQGVYTLYIYIEF